MLTDFPHLSTVICPSWLRFPVKTLMGFICMTGFSLEWSTKKTAPRSSPRNISCRTRKTGNGKHSYRNKNNMHSSEAIYTCNVNRCKNTTIWWYSFGCFRCNWYSNDSNWCAKVDSGVFSASCKVCRILLKEITFCWALRGISVIVRFDSITIFAAKGSRNMLNSANLFVGTLKTFPALSFPSMTCPPTTYTFCNRCKLNKVWFAWHYTKLMLWPSGWRIHLTWMTLFPLLSTSRMLAKLVRGPLVSTVILLCLGRSDFEMDCQTSRADACPSARRSSFLGAPNCTADFSGVYLEKWWSWCI